jgi:hypothetical protein
MVAEQNMEDRSVAQQKSCRKECEGKGYTSLFEVGLSRMNLTQVTQEGKTHHGTENESF